MSLWCPLVHFFILWGQITFSFRVKDVSDGGKLPMVDIILHAATMEGVGVPVAEVVPKVLGPYSCVTFEVVSAHLIC